ncbi:MAG: hypothetical protein KGI33_05420 [Thaumarchaeota archaeon]|nr:hypothetical protein [Nitrososphaerota archaeon]
MAEIIYGLDTEVWLVIATFIGSFGAIITSVFTIRYAKMEHERETLGLIYRILSDPAHKVAARNIVQAYVGGAAAEERDAETVVRNYDRVVQFVDLNLVPEKKYCKVFGRSMVVLYTALRSWWKPQGRDRTRSWWKVLAAFQRRA